MNRFFCGAKLTALILCVSLGTSAFAVSASASDGSGEEGSGEVLSSCEQGTTGTYTAAESGYYLINLRGADGGDGQDVHIESDGVGSTDECRGNAYGTGGSGAEGGSVSTLVYLKKGQTVSYSIGSDGTNYVEEAYRFEDLQRGCIHVYPNSNPIYKPDEYVDAGYGGGGGEGTWAAIDDIVIAGAAGGGGGGGSVAACANWGEGSYYGFKDPSGFKNTSGNGGDAEAVAEEISETFESVESFNGTDGVKSKGESVQTGEYWPAVLFGKVAPKAPKYELTEFEPGDGGASGTSYINKTEGLYYGDTAPDDVLTSGAYINASKPQTSGITITFVWKYEFPLIFKFFEDEELFKEFEEDSDGDTQMKIPVPNTDGYFKGWVNSKDKSNVLTLDYYSDNTLNADGNLTESASFHAEFYSEEDMGKTTVSNAKAQAVSISDENGEARNAIRFIAVVDGDYAKYRKAGFVISSVCKTPTIEAGYPYSEQYSIYRSITAKSSETGKTECLSVESDEIERVFDGFGQGAGLLYTNLIIGEGKENVTYYAVPYVIDKKGNCIYGKVRAVSFGELTELDLGAAG